MAPAADRNTAVVTLACKPEWEATCYRAPGKCIHSRLSEIACPVVVVAGADSWFMEKDALQGIAAKFTRSTFIDVAGGGHFVPQENPEKFSDIIAESLGKLDGCDDGVEVHGGSSGPRLRSKL